MKRKQYKKFSDHEVTYERHHNNSLARSGESKLKVRNYKYVDKVKRGGCEVCGYNEMPEKIHFHHIDPDTMRDRVSNLVAWRYSLNTIKEEIAKCAVLCQWCHHKVHRGKLTLYNPGREIGSTG